MPLSEADLMIWYILYLSQEFKSSSKKTLDTPKPLSAHTDPSFYATSETHPRSVFFF
jgi:hypothetical protein